LAEAFNQSPWGKEGVAAPAYSAFASGMSNSGQRLSSTSGQSQVVGAGVFFFAGGLMTTTKLVVSAGFAPFSQGRT
jgi:hypothetical protein